jgi:SAM-dependent methyltransferase
MEKLLHLGCGQEAPPQWTNVDGSWNAWLGQHPFLKWIVGAARLVPKEQLQVPWPKNIVICDLRKPLPWPDGSYDACYSSHFIEHLHRAEAVRVLRDVRRVLRRGGVCRTLVPDLDSVIKEYLGQTSQPHGSPESEGDPARRLNQRLHLRPEQPPRLGWFYSTYRAKTDYNTHKFMYDELALIKLMEEAGFRDCRRRGLHDSEIPHIDKVEPPGRVLNGIGVVVEGVKF